MTPIAPTSIDPYNSAPDPHNPFAPAKASAVTLAVGTRVGVYEVLSLLGAGGMGEVYRARDTRLNREVALKVLPDAFASEPERLARFEREAQVLASLNHPHIATIYGFDEAVSQRSTPIRALAMELVPGETLAERLSRGRLTVAEALDLARQIAQALEAAHELGIVHRDLKPANIHVTPNGTVKVLDFGLAKLVAPDAAEASDSRRSHNVSLSPTITSPAMATSVGVLLGTAAYMSPEQAKGREAGPRSDVWAFGCVLFEMLTGHSPFRGEDVTETLAAILMRDPDWSRVPVETPINVQRLLKRCLRREPAQRLHSIADARIELDDEPLPSVTPTAPPAPARRAARLPWVFAVAALLLAGALLADRPRSDTETAAKGVAFSIAPPADATVDDEETLLAIAPDGQTMVLSYTQSAVTQLFRRRLDQLDAVPIAGTERASGAFFSPDGQWLAFSQGTKLRKVAIGGGPAVDVGERAFGAGAWNADDVIVYTPNYASGLWRAPATGGEARKLTEPVTKDGELGHWHPQFLPDGKTVVFTNYRVPADSSRIEAYSLDTGQRRVLAERGMFGRYVTTGHLLFVRGTTVFAMPFDPAGLVARGSATPVLEGVAAVSQEASAQLMVSSNGTLAYIADRELNAPRRLMWITRNGTAAPVGIDPRRFAMPELSPDGRSIAAIVDDAETDIWIADVERGVVRRFTDAPGTQSSPVWMPDSRGLLFASEEPAFHIYKQTIGATVPPERLVDGALDAMPMSVLPNGDGVLYIVNDPVTRTDIWLLPLTGDRKPRAIVKTRFSETDARISADGRRLAYVADDSGRSEVYLQSFPDGGDRTQVSIGGATQVRWSADGRELFFRSGDQMMRVSVGAGTPVSVSRPVELFRAQFLPGYSVARDGRFLVAQRDPGAPQARVNVILNWSAQLRARVPVP